MPRIPVYQRQTELRGYQPATMQNTRPDLGAEYMERATTQFGDSAQNLVRSGVQLKLGLDDQARLENQKIEAAEVLAAKVELSRSLDEQSKGTIDPVTGVKNPGLMDREGKDAIGIQKDFQDHYNKEAARIAAGLTNPQAKVAFQQFSLADKEARRQDYAAREFDQMKRFQGNQQEALDLMAGNLAADESTSDALALAALGDAKKGFRAMNAGQAPEVLAAGEAARDSHFAAARFAAARDHAGKKAAYDKYGHLLQGEQALKARETLKFFGVKEEAQDIVYKLSAKHELDTQAGRDAANEALEKINKIEVHDEVKHRLKAAQVDAIQRKTALNKEAQVYALGQIQSGVRATDIKGFKAMPADLQATVKEMDRDYIRGKQVDKQLDQVYLTNPKRYDELSAMSNSDDPKEFERFLNLTSEDWMIYRGSMTEQDVRGFQAMQNGIKKTLAKETTDAAKAAKKAEIDQSIAYGKVALNDLQRELVPGAREGDKAGTAAVEGKRGRIADAWQRKKNEHYQRFGRPPTDMEVISWKNQLRDKVDVLDAAGKVTETNFWELTGNGRETGNQYKDMAEYQKAQELSDAEMLKLRIAYKGRSDAEITEILNDEAMGDYSATFTIPFRKNDSFRGEAREQRAKEVERLAKEKEKAEAPQREKDQARADRLSKYREELRKNQSDPKYGMGGAMGGLTPKKKLAAEKGS